MHARLPAALAELQSAWEMFLSFALEVGAIAGPESKELEDRCQKALRELAVLQAAYQESDDPAARFVALLRVALARREAHLADRSGSAPDEAAAWGWRLKQKGRTWEPQGPRIGWVSGSDVFLEPSISYQVAQQMAGAERLLGSEQTLRHRLHERGLLASTDAGRKMVQVRRRLEGGLKQVLHLKSSALLDPST
jgi:hypothetical protein